MIIENKKNKAFKSHLKLFKIYKELKSILPFGYIKTRVSPSQKYSFKKQHILLNLEKEKNKEKSPTKITKNLLYNKNIYIFSEENDKTKKIISKLKKYYSYNKPKKNFSIKNESNIIKDAKNSSDNSRNINNNNFVLNLNTIYLKNNKIYYLNGLKEDNNCINDLKKNISRNEYDIIPNNIRKYYRSSSINNCVMKNNIYLPSIINRLKNSLPRNQRNSSGFILNGFGIKHEKNENININNSYLDINNVNDGKKYRFIKNKSGPVYLLSYDNKNDKQFDRNIKGKKKNKSHLYKKKLKIYDDIEIIGIKKIFKNK